MDIAIDAMTKCFTQIGNGNSIEHARLQMDTPVGWLRLQPGALPSEGYMGFKAYCLTKNYGPRYVLFLYDLGSGEIISILDADTLTVRRTAGHSAVATRYLSNEDSKTLGVLGSGSQARAMAEAICKVRPIDLIKVYSPNQQHREKFAKDMQERLNLTIEVKDNPRDVVNICDILATASGNKTSTPILSGDWLSEGTHINAIGAVGRGRVEIDLESMKRSSIIVVDSMEECVTGSQELIDGISALALKKENVKELSAIVVGKTQGRISEKDITLFKSQGSGVQDVAAAQAVYAEVVRLGLGKDVGEIGPALRSRQ